MSEEFEVGVELMVWANITVEADSFEAAHDIVNRRLSGRPSLGGGVLATLKKVLRKGVNDGINDHSYHIVGVSRTDSKMYS